MMKQKSNHTTLKIKLTQALFYLNTLIWLGFSIYMFLDMAVFNDNRISALIVGIFMLGNAGAMLLGGIMIGKRYTWTYYFAFMVLVVNMLLTLTDQFGIYDLITFLIDLALLLLLISFRKEYFSRS